MISDRVNKENANLIDQDHADLRKNKHLKHEDKHFRGVELGLVVSPM